MWNNDESFMDGGKGGGYMNSPSQFSSQTPVKKERQVHNIAPVTIKTIHDSTGDAVMVEDHEINMIVVVGIIQSVDISTTKTTYKIDDSTGIIEGVHWLESDPEMDSDFQGPLMEMTYCKVVGTVRTQKDQKHILIHNIMPLTDANRLTTHILEVIHTPLKLLQLEEMNRVNGASMAGPGEAGTSFNTGIPGQVSSESNMQGLSGPSRKVYQIIKMCMEEVGINKKDIYGSLMGDIAPQKIDQILDDLSSEGLIFCSIDEDHFKASDS